MGWAGLGGVKDRWGKIRCGVWDVVWCVVWGVVSGVGRGG